MRRRRSRVRWVLKWAGTVACGLILVAIVASLVWLRIVLFNDDGGGISLFPLELFVSWVDTSSLASSSWFFAYAWSYSDWGDWRDQLSQCPWVPTFERDAQGVAYLSMPLWLPFVLLAIPSALLWWADRRRIRPGGCSNCGYDLTGNVSGRCPECGAAAEAKTGASG